MKNKIFDIFLKNTKQSPKKTALIFNKKSYSYEYLLQIADKIANRIAIAKEKNVAVLLDNTVEFVALLLAASKTDVILVPFDKSTTKSQLKTLYEKIDIAYQYSENGLKKIAQQNYTSKIRLNHPYIIVSTSGSTSEPKPIILTQAIKLKRIDIACKTYGLKSSDTILVSTPLHHSLAQRGVLLGLTLGATVALMEHFSPTKYLETIEEAHVTFSFSVSNQLESIVELINQYDVQSIKKMVSSSSAIKSVVKKRLLNYFDIHECYGTSEIGCVTELSQKDLNKHLASVGKPMDGVEIKILDQNGEGVGEIAVKSPWRFQEYYKLTETTNESFEEDFFKTGDLGVLKNGFLYYYGREKEMIKTGGISVYPMDIEKILKEVEGVNEIAVVGVEDSYFGEAVIAIFTGNAKVSDIRKVAKEKLLSYQQPLYYEKVCTLPKNSMNKLQKFKLKERYANLDLGKRLKGLL